jgi:signal transduction histidine kinase
METLSRLGYNGYMITGAVSNSPSLYESEYSQELLAVLTQIAEEMLAAIEATSCYFYTTSPNQDFIPFMAAGSLLISEREAFYRENIHPSTDILLNRLLESKSTILSADALNDSRITPSILNDLGCDVIMALPVLNTDEIVGMVLISRRTNTSPFTVQQARLAQAITASMSLALQNARLYEETSNRLSESQSLRQITLALLQKLSLEEILEIVCREAQRLTHSTGALVALLEDDNTLKIMCHTGTHTQLPNRFRVQDSLFGLAVRREKPLVINNRHAHEGNNGESYPASILAIPLIVQKKPLGVLGVVDKPGGFGNEDMRLIELFADQTAVVVEHARMSQRMQLMAVVEERERLSRELHDSVNQLLYGIALYAEAAERQLANGESESVQDYLKSLKSSADQALHEMRLLIYELRPQILEEKGLAAAIQTRLNSVEEKLGLEAAFKHRLSNSLDDKVEQALYGIAQEALNNVVKHSNAKHVNVFLVQSGQTLVLRVEDDGAGFDPQKVGQGGMGLRTIRERASALNAAVEISSSPGEGTRVSVEVKI